MKDSALAGVLMLIVAIAIGGLLIIIFILTANSTIDPIQGASPTEYAPSPIPGIIIFIIILLALTWQGYKELKNMWRGLKYDIFL